MREKRNLFLEKINYDSPSENYKLVLVSKEEYKKRMVFWMIMLGITLAVVIATMLINYLVFLPWKIEKSQSGPDPLPPFSLADSSYLMALIIAVILMVMATAFYVIYFTFTLKYDYNDKDQKAAKSLGAGFAGGFFDTIGVGSFGVITGVLKASKGIKDDTKLPGTLNVALGVSALFEASLFVSSIKVNITTLMVLMVSLIVGTFVGSMFVSKIKDQKLIKIIVGTTLFFVGILMILSHPNVDLIKTSNIGDQNSLVDKWWRIFVGTIIFFFLGMIQSFGIGLYAPAMASLSFLGLGAAAIFPIMACGSALSMLPAAYSFIKRRQFMQRTANHILSFASFGVISAFLLVFIGLQMGAGMDEQTFNAVLKWMAVVVIFYVSITMIVEYILLKKKENKTNVKQIIGGF